MGQELVVVEKNDIGKINTRSVLSVAFVPFTRAQPAAQVKTDA